MRDSVGKPTLDKRLAGMRSRKLVRIDLGAGRKLDDRPGQREAVAGADHRRDRLLALAADRAAVAANGPIRRRSAKRSAASTASSSACSRAASLSVFVDPGDAQLARPAGACRSRGRSATRDFASA